MKFEQEQLKAILQPPTYHPSELGHQRAYYRLILERIFYSHLLTVWMVDKGDMPDSGRRDIDGTRSIKRLCLESINSYFNSWHGDHEVWEFMYDYEQFKKDFESYLSEIHDGDCVAEPVMCIRCYAEDLYGIGNSVSWSGKEEGHRLYRRWLSLYRGEE